MTTLIALELRVGKKSECGDSTLATYRISQASNGRKMAVLNFGRDFQYNRSILGEFVAECQNSDMKVDSVCITTSPGKGISPRIFDIFVMDIENVLSEADPIVTLSYSALTDVMDY